MAFLFLIMFGLTINSVNAGGVHSLDEAKHHVVDSMKHPQQPDWSKLND